MHALPTPTCPDAPCSDDFVGVSGVRTSGVGAGREGRPCSAFLAEVVRRSFGAARPALITNALRPKHRACQPYIYFYDRDHAVDVDPFIILMQPISAGPEINCGDSQVCREKISIPNGF